MSKAPVDKKIATNFLANLISKVDDSALFQRIEEVDDMVLRGGHFLPGHLP